MSAGPPDTPGADLPEFLSWDELQKLPEDIAAAIELWERKVVRNRRGPLEHQRFAVRMRNALETGARRAMQGRRKPRPAGLRWPRPHGSGGAGGARCRQRR